MDDNPLLIVDAKFALGRSHEALVNIASSTHLLACLETNKKGLNGAFHEALRYSLGAHYKDPAATDEDKIMRELVRDTRGFLEQGKLNPDFCDNDPAKGTIGDLCDAVEQVYGLDGPAPGA